MSSQMKLYVQLDVLYVTFCFVSLFAIDFIETDYQHHLKFTPEKTICS